MKRATTRKDPAARSAQTILAEWRKLGRARPSRYTRKELGSQGSVVFGVPASVSLDRLYEAAFELYSILDNRPDQFVMQVSPARSPVERHWFTFIGAPGRGYRLEPWVESLHESLNVPLDVVYQYGSKIRARRYASLGRGQAITPDPLYLKALGSTLALRVAAGDGPLASQELVNLDDLDSLLHVRDAADFLAGRSDSGW